MVPFGQNYGSINDPQSYKFKSISWKIEDTNANFKRHRCNWFGNYDIANTIQYSGSTQFQAAALAPYTVDGTEMGQFKSVGDFSFLRVYKAGHEVPYYRELEICRRTL
jgi:carboxypeptidase C (cathepsin A)